MYTEIVLGIVQGITEWLPVSSTAVIILVQEWFSGIDTSFSSLLSLALFLHLGTFFAALIYFWKDAIKIIKTIFAYAHSDESQKRLVQFLFISTLVSGFVGFLLFEVITIIDTTSLLSGSIINLVIGSLLLVTGITQITLRKKDGIITTPKTSHGVLLGILQGLSALPGLSRSGITVAGLLLQNFNQKEALRLSFLMSLPIVLVGNIFLNAGSFVVTSGNLVGLLFSFVIGLLTIHVLIKIAERINFGYFVLFFGILVLVSSLISLA